MSRVLLVCAHPDDEILGAGGTLAKHVGAGDDVAVLILCSRSDAHREAAKRAAEVVGYRVIFGDVLDGFDQRFDELSIADLADSIKEYAHGALWTGSAKNVPGVVYLHSPKDLNQDHQRAAHATLIACRPSSMPSVQEVLAFEVPSSSEWGLAPFSPTLFVSFCTEEREKKDKAWDCYEYLEGQKFPLPRDTMSILARDSWRGATIGQEYAEAFEVIRMTR
jgi:N-acetylglucosamine malate deacetylase 1